MLINRLTLAFVSLLGFASAAHAAHIRVTTTEDSFDGACDHHCSLREAIHVANTTPGDHRIILDIGTYQLSLPPPMLKGVLQDEDEGRNGDLDIIGSLTIRGAGPDRTIIDAQGLDRVFDVLDYATLDLRNLAVRNGLHPVDGGGIRNGSLLALRQVHLRDNRVFNKHSPTQGGAIANYGVLDVFSSQLHNNQSESLNGAHSRGGAIFNALVLKVRDSRFENNRALGGAQTRSSGAALYTFGNADIARSALLNNRSDGEGGAISNRQLGIVKISNSSLYANGNGAAHPGAVLSNGLEESGRPSMQLIHVTLADNRGYGLDNRGDLSVRNSIILGNRSSEGAASNCRHNPGDSAFSARGLLLGAESLCQADLRVANNELFSRVLQPAHDDGGPRTGFFPRLDGPALEAGVGSCARHDQVGLPRPQDGNGDGVARCDLGAFERPGI